MNDSDFFIRKEANKFSRNIKTCAQPEKPWIWPKMTVSYVKLSAQFNPDVSWSKNDSSILWSAHFWKNLNQKITMFNTFRQFKAVVRDKSI